MIVDRLRRVVFRVTGEKPLAYLQDVVAQDVADLTPGRGALAAVLTAKGRVAAEVRILPLGDAVLLDAEEEARAGIEHHIARHAPLAGCEVVDVTGEFVVAAVRGPNVAPDVPSREAAFSVEGGVLVVRVVWGVPGVDLIGPPESVDAALTSIHGIRATADDLEAARIEAGRARFGPDFNEDVLVNETPLLRYGVSMTKGCYPGQESVARVHNLGRVRRVLRGLRSDSPLMPGGSITSASGRAAIALIDSEIPIGTTVHIDGLDATVTELP